MKPAVVVALIAIAFTAGSMRTEAHKPITSPFTFADDVLPIVKARCASCHSPGGAAPMSLLTHADAVPWGESIRVELMAGHMPPWGADVTGGRFRNVQQFSAREMNILLTWASGGTPSGQGSQEATAQSTPQWALGQPDATLELPRVEIASDEQTRVEEFVLPIPARPLRAADLLPGTPAVVRRATISVRPAPGASADKSVERLIALWVPGDHPVPLDEGLGFQVPPGSELVVRIQYVKTWQYERQVLTDRSAVGLYFAQPQAMDVRVLRLSTAAGAQTFAQTVDEDVRAIAVYADADLGGGTVAAVAVRPDGSREELIAFRPREEWTRRYWFREPMSLPRGTRIEVSANFETLLPPAAAPPQQREPASASLALNVVNVPTRP